MILCGKCGTGKSHALVDSIQDQGQAILLTLTNSNVGNLRSICLVKNVRVEVMTLHKYFGISVSNEKMYKRKALKHTELYIDEFSLINFNIFKIICSYMNKLEVLILAGDLLQLNSIDEKSRLTYSFNEPSLNGIDMTVNETIIVCNKLANSLKYNKVFKKASKLYLSKNYRSNSKVYNIYLDFMFNDKYELITVNECPNLIQREGYTVLSTRFKHLKHINQFILYGEDRMINTRVGLVGSKVKFTTNENFGLISNNSEVIIVGDELVCGDVRHKVKLLSLNELETSGKTPNETSGKTPNETSAKTPNETSGKTSAKNMSKQMINISPSYLCTITKSQGLSLDKCIVVLDDIYSCDFLYVAILRARYDVKFVILHINSDPIIENVKLMNKCFRICDEVIYSSNL